MVKKLPTFEPLRYSSKCWMSGRTPEDDQMIRVNRDLSLWFSVTDSLELFL